MATPPKSGANPFAKKPPKGAKPGKPGKDAKPMPPWMAKKGMKSGGKVC